MLIKENVLYEDLMDVGVGVDIDENFKSFVEGIVVEVRNNWFVFVYLMWMVWVDVVYWLFNIFLFV